MRDLFHQKTSNEWRNLLDVICVIFIQGSGRLGFNKPGTGFWAADFSKGVCMNLRLHYRSVRNKIVVYCAGKITFGEEAKLLFNQVAALLSKGREVVLHLGDVETVDAAGLGTLAQLAALARSYGSEMRVCSLREHVEALLNLTHLSQMLRVCESEKEALSAPGESLPGLSSGIPAVA